MNRAIIYLAKTYGFAFAREYRGWRKYRGFGAQEALRRIRDAHRNGSNPISIVR